ncbi:MAG: hemolysin family protein [Defluviicoccus sp.]|nr:hemolysin family protein [Defluviicoccus sp.]MDG4593441.1 hemolysin family protein [Defluviicoccus sp.]
MLALDLVVVLMLIVVNGFLAMAELAMVSVRPSQLKVMAQQGSSGAARALQLSVDPGRFLSTVQVGITLVGVLTGAFSGATIAEALAGWLAAAGVPASLVEPVALAAVVVVIVYLTLIVGELVPKRLALRNPAGTAAAVAMPLELLARVAAPAVWLLDRSSHLAMRLMGLGHTAQPAVTEEEIKALIREGEAAGIVEPAEGQMLSSILRLGDRTARSVMTPRPDVDWINLDGDQASIRVALRQTRHSRLPACRGRIDEVVGVVQTKDVLNACLSDDPLDVGNLVRNAIVVHEGADVLDVIEMLRTNPIHMALVVDEYGSFEGIVTATDILSAIVGSLDQPVGPEDAPAVQREDGSWLLDGSMPVDNMADILELALPPGQDFHTVAGFVLSHLRRLPTPGESFLWRGWRFEVVDMDGRRIDKILAERAPATRRR